jgi:hypothetical protein
MVDNEPTAYECLEYECEYAEAADCQFICHRPKYMKCPVKIAKLFGWKRGMGRVTKK